MKLSVFIAAEHTNSIRRIPDFRIDLGKSLTTIKPNGETVLEIKDQIVAEYWNKFKKMAVKIGNTPTMFFYTDNTLKMNEITLCYKNVWADAEIGKDETILSICNDFIKEIDNEDTEQTNQINNQI